MDIFSWIFRPKQHRTKRHNCAHLQNRQPITFDEHCRKEKAFDSRNRGIRSVPLHQIVGSVGRYQDFDNQFRPGGHTAKERLAKIHQAMQLGQTLPPVKLYRIRNDYYVIDGNHRISAAKELGHDDIVAQIIEFIPSKKSLNNLLFQERADFFDRTQLNADINLTEVGQYRHLIQQITGHQHFLNQQYGSISIKKAAADWHKTIYQPLCAIIRKSRLLDSFPKRTISDLYVYISVHQWEKGRQRRYGIGIDKLIPKKIEEFRNKMNGLDKFDYPEMQRWITAFVLMNVQAKREHHIMEKLFELNEVKEIHCVHGDVDLLVKIVMTHDLLSSDAENISQFVHEKIRQLTGVISTKTLIPGFSKTKTNVKKKP